MWLVCAALLFTALLPAQSEKASLSGVIGDSTGAAVPGACVTGESLTTGVKTTTVTNETGSFYLALLPGEYRIEGLRFHARASPPPWSRSWR